MKVTNNRTHDSQCAIELPENSMENTEVLGGKIKEVIADAGYDTHEIFRYLAGRGIRTVIRVRRKAVITGNRARDKVVRQLGMTKRIGERLMVMVGVGTWRVSLFKVNLFLMDQLATFHLLFLIAPAT